MVARGSRLKYGCLGCLGVMALVLAVVTVVSGLAYFTALPERVGDRVLTPDLSAGIARAGSTGGRVVLKVQEAELRVEPADPGEPLRIEGHYDMNAFALEGTLESRSDGVGLWVYRATFGRAERSGAFAGLVSLIRGSTARIRLFLPADLPIDLELEMREGGAVVRLGGLWLRNATFEFESGAFDMNVGEPLREPMESLSIHTAKGGALLNRLGNASPRRLDVSYSVGGIDMDLGGKWLADADIRITGGTGGGVVHLPSGVILEGLERRGIEARRGLPPKSPTLRFEVSTGVGRLEFADLAIYGAGG